MSKLTMHLTIELLQHRSLDMDDIAGWEAARRSLLEGLDIAQTSFAAWPLRPNAADRPLPVNSGIAVHWRVSQT